MGLDNRSLKGEPMAQQTSRIDVTIEYAPFAKLADGRYRINSWAIVTEGRDKTPMANETIMFLIDGVEDGDLPTTARGEPGNTYSMPHPKVPAPSSRRGWKETRSIATEKR